MKRRILMLLTALVLVFAFAFAGCGESGGNAGGGTTGTGGTEQGGTEQGGTEQGGEGGEEVERKLRNLPADVEYEVDSYEHEIEDAESGVKLYGYIYRPIEVGKFPVVIMCHGFNGNYDDFPRECERLAQRGYVAYAFDFAGAQVGGKSTGRTKDDYSPLTMKEDLIIAIKHFKQLKWVDNSQIFVWGGSQGGFVAGLTAADDRVKDDIAALALYFPAFNIPDDHKADPEQTFPFMGYYLNADFIRSVKNLDPFAVIPAYRGDVCIVWGDQDALVKRTYIDQAAAAYGDRATINVLTGDGAGHGFSGAALNRAIDIVMAFLEAHTYETPN